MLAAREADDVEMCEIGWVRSSRNEPIDDEWDTETSAIELDGRQFSPRAVRGLEGFSHLEVVYFFHLVDPEDIETGARRPRGNPAWPEVGIFAQRARSRPNRIGVCTCRLLRVEGTRLEVCGLDAIDGTPVLDIKPLLTEFGPRGTVSQPQWAHDLMRSYWSSHPAAD
jgi:tRNA-Thr(GGU) m(6)t(6)A37 methyltransferase TsaA